MYAKRVLQTLHAPWEVFPEFASKRPAHDLRSRSHYSSGVRTLPSAPDNPILRQICTEKDAQRSPGLLHNPVATDAGHERALLAAVLPSLPSEYALRILCSQAGEAPRKPSRSAPNTRTI